MWEERPQNWRWEIGENIREKEMKKYGRLEERLNNLGGGRVGLLILYTLPP